MWHSTLYYSVIQNLITSRCGLKQNRPHLTSPSCDAGCGQMFTTYAIQATQVGATAVSLHTRVNSLGLDAKMWRNIPNNCPHKYSNTNRTAGTCMWMYECIFMSTDMRSNCLFVLMFAQSHTSVSVFVVWPDGLDPGVSLFSAGCTDGVRLVFSLHHSTVRLCFTCFDLLASTVGVVQLQTVLHDTRPIHLICIYMLISWSIILVLYSQKIPKCNPIQLAL